jgi:hypothetical protein
MRTPRKWWRSRSAREDAGVVRGTYVVEAEMHRAEELRPDLLGVPSEDELNDRPHDPWRPARSLGPLPKS